MPWNEAAHPRTYTGAPSRGFGANYAKTAMLMAFLVALLAIGGQLFGGTGGMLLFGAIGLVINFVSFWFSDRIALAAHRAQPVTREQLPAVFEMVERLTRRAGMPMPAIYVIPSPSPNAFATGRSPSHAAVAVTQGILQLLEPRELEGVIAHELAHVRNRDTLIATLAAAVAGLIASLGHVIQWGAFLGLGGRADDEEGGGAGNVVAALAWAIIAPLVAMVVQMAVSRSREFGADATGAGLMGDAEPLARALEKLEQGSQVIPYQYGGPATAHLFIVNPFHGAGARMMELLSTHPPLEERIRRLRAMRGSGFGSY